MFLAVPVRRLTAARATVSSAALEVALAHCEAVVLGVKREHQRLVGPLKLGERSFEIRRSNPGRVTQQSGDELRLADGLNGTVGHQLPLLLAQRGRQTGI